MMTEPDCSIEEPAIVLPPDDLDRTGQRIVIGQTQERRMGQRVKPEYAEGQKPRAKEAEGSAPPTGMNRRSFHLLRGLG